MKRFSLALVLMSVLTVSAQQKAKVSDLDLTKMKQEYGVALVGKTVTAEAARINGMVYKDAIGTHAKSVLKILLDKYALRFSADVGVADCGTNPEDGSLAVSPLVDGTKILWKRNGDEKQFAGLVGKDGKIERGSVCFVVKGDGKELFNSGVVRGGESPVHVDVDLKGVSLLEMYALPTDDGASGDHALWISPEIEYTVKAPRTTDAGAIDKGPEMTGETADRLMRKMKELSVFKSVASDKTPFDWLLSPEKSQAGIYVSADGKGIVAANAMVSRTFRIFPNLATTDYVNRMTGESMLRAVSEEGTVCIDGQEYTIGGLSGQPERAYIKEEWLERLNVMPESFMVEDFEVGDIKEEIKWARRRWALNKEAATGRELVFTLRGSKAMSDIVVKLYFSVYDHIPVIRKRMEVVNHSAFPVNVTSFKLERLAFAEPESPVGGNPEKFMLPNIHVESDFHAGGSFTEKETDVTEKWVADPAYTSQRNYSMRTPCIMEVAPRWVPTNASGQERRSALSVSTKCPLTVMTASVRDSSPVGSNSPLRLGPRRIPSSCTSLPQTLPWCAEPWTNVPSADTR